MACNSNGEDIVLPALDHGTAQKRVASEGGELEGFESMMAKARTEGPFTIREEGGPTTSSEDSSCDEEEDGELGEMRPGKLRLKVAIQSCDAIVDMARRVMRRRS